MQLLFARSFVAGARVVQLFQSVCVYTQKHWLPDPSHSSSPFVAIICFQSPLPNEGNTPVIERWSCQVSPTLLVFKENNLDMRQHTGTTKNRRVIMEHEFLIPS